MFAYNSAFNQPLAAWSSRVESVTDAGFMFGYAAAWLEKFERTDGGTSYDGPPSSWRIKT